MIIIVHVQHCSFVSVGVSQHINPVGHFVSSPRERGRREIEEIVEMKERDSREREENEEREEIKAFPLHPYLLQE